MLHGQRNSAGSGPDAIQFVRGAKSAPAGDDTQLDKAGQTILQLLNKAADVAENNSRHAIDMAQKLSHQLRAAEDRIAELEAAVATYQERADRAEEWLHKVYSEIENRFLSQDRNTRRAAR
jgi:hypothetical protein